MDIDNITSIKISISKRKILFFFMLLAEKSPEIFPTHKRYFFISESFALN